MTSAEAGELAVVRRLYEVMGRINAGADLGEVLDSIAQCVVDVLGFGIAAISRLDGETLVMTAVAGDEEVKSQILGVRTPISEIITEFEVADEWGILRFVPHDRMPSEEMRSVWIPDIESTGEADAWDPLDALYAPLFSPTGELLGNMSVDLPPGNKIPNKANREILEMFIVQAGIAMYNAQQRERLADQVRLGDATRHIVATAGRVLDLAEVLSGAARPMMEALRANGVWIRVGTDRGGLEEHSVVIPERLAAQASSELVDAAGRTAKAAWAVRRAAVVSLRGPSDATLLDPLAHEEALKALREQSWASLLAVPMGAGPEAFGHIVLMREEGEPEWTAEEISSALELGRELGRTVVHTRLLDKERQLVSELQEIDKYKGELIATIAHELRNPLTSIQGHIEMLGDEPNSSGQSIDAIARNAVRMDALVQDLLTLSRLEDLDRELPRELVELRSLCEASIDLFKIQAAQAGVELELVAPVSSVRMLGSPDELGRVVDNLVGNAVKYTPSSGRVVLLLRENQECVEISCQDTGLGISEADIGELFTEFNRSSNPVAQALPGTGLGLAIAQRIVHRHSGEIAVDSRLGEGTTFTVRLPRS